MNNYYDMCIEEIKNLLNEGNDAMALMKVRNELDMPYVPEPYFSMFESLLNDIVVDQRPKSQFFVSIADIEDALRGNEALQQKAILSLERMNLRQDMDWCRSVLVHQEIQDWIKKQILLFMMEQEINGAFDVEINQQKLTLNIEYLLHPQASESYQQCALDLQNILESHNPSMLILCLGELDYLALETFPNALKSTDARTIIERVESYF